MHMKDLLTYYAFIILSSKYEILGFYPNEAIGLCRGTIS
jgi:hypothetical protein